MSAFLGPIHVKMYRRVLQQDAMSQAIIDLAKSKDWTQTLGAEVDAAAPAASTEPLESIIDPLNIHGWLNAAVAQCERRFAAAVRGALGGRPERLDALKALMKELGRAGGLPQPSDAQGAFDAIHDILLDGMPCDFPFNTLDVNADMINWQVTGCPHAPHWVEAGCDVDTYYQLRDAWVEGSLERTGFAHMRRAPYDHVLKREH